MLYYIKFVVSGIKTPFACNRPDRTWTKKFFKRNKLSLKKASMICISRKSNTTNPFVIYDFYDKLQFILDSNPDITAENIWNCDESGFPTDPVKSKVVGPTNQPAYKLSFGARRGNITTLVVCSASGKVLDPLIRQKFSVNLARNTSATKLLLWCNKEWLDGNQYLQ